VKYNTKQYNTM